jgi:transcription termination factor Rho
MDDVIFEEFKGTGNMELILNRKLSEKRIFPAMDIAKSGTRREELLLSKEELNAMWDIRRAFSNMQASDVTERILRQLTTTKSNGEFVQSIKKILR